MGRRISREINGEQTQYLYHGLQAIAELDSSGSIQASYHTGLMLDEVLARYSQTRDQTLLTDALGSVIALADEDGDITQRYAYSPFGETQSWGQSTGNPLQYTGRENDGTGLYYYRARYYSPEMNRFISPDPIGLRAGDPNFYRYVMGDPINYYDPLGLWRFGDPLPQWIVDRAAGFGDGISGGLTHRFREWQGTNAVVDQSSSAYQNSRVAGAVTSLASGTGAVATGSRAGIGFFGGMDLLSTGVGVVSDRNAQSVMDAALLGGQEWVTRRIGLGNDLGSRLLAAQFDGTFGGMRMMVESSWGGPCE